MSENEIKLPHLRLPADFAPFLDKLILTLYKLSKSSTAADLKDKDSSLPDPVTIGRALSYLEYLSIVDRVGNGVYDLTDKGRKIGIELYQEHFERADKLWCEALSNHPLYAQLQKYIEEKGGGVRGSSIGFAEYLRDIAGTNWKTSFLKSGGTRLCNLMSAKGVIVFDQKEDSISLKLNKKIVPPIIGQKKTPPAPPPKGDNQISGSNQQPIDTSISPTVFNVDVKLMIEISKDTSVELADKIFDFLLKLNEKKVQTQIKTRES